MRPRSSTAACAALSLGLGVGAAHAQTRTPAPRGPTVELWYRHTSLPEPGGDGGTHAAGVGLFPLHGVRVLRWVRLGVGGEFALRAGANGHSDGLVQTVASAGLQFPSKLMVPFVVAVASGGFAVEQRFQRTFAQFVYTLGGEVGTEVRLGPLGLGIAFGYGRTVEGAVYQNATWLRVIVPVF